MILFTSVKIMRVLHHACHSSKITFFLSNLEVEIGPVRRSNYITKIKRHQNFIVIVLLIVLNTK